MKQTVFIYGMHTVSAVLQHKAKSIECLYILKERRDESIKNICEHAEKNGLQIQFCSRADLDRLSNQSNHQGVAASCFPLTPGTESELAFFLETLNVPPLLLILDNVQDPHNLGACFRNANAAGVHAIIAPRDKSAGLSAAVHKVASGASYLTPFFQVTNLARTLVQLKNAGIWLYGLAGEASTSLYALNLQGAVGLVLGSEGTGLRQLTMSHCDQLAHIPMQGSVPSLNVSAAAGIALFEVVRQRQGLTA